MDRSRTPPPRTRSRLLCRAHMVCHLSHRFLPLHPGALHFLSSIPLLVLCTYGHWPPAPARSNTMPFCILHWAPCLVSLRQSFPASPLLRPGLKNCFSAFFCNGPGVPWACVCVCVCVHACTWRLTLHASHVHIKWFASAMLQVYLPAGYAQTVFSFPHG